jgi:hypothetical protein
VISAVFSNTLGHKYAGHSQAESRLRAAARGSVWRILVECVQSSSKMRALAFFLAYVGCAFATLTAAPQPSLVEMIIGYPSVDPKVVDYNDAGFLLRALMAAEARISMRNVRITGFTAFYPVNQSIAQALTVISSDPINRSPVNSIAVQSSSSSSGGTPVTFIADQDLKWGPEMWHMLIVQVAAESGAVATLLLNRLSQRLTESSVLESNEEYVIFAGTLCKSANCTGLDSVVLSVTGFVEQYNPQINDDPEWDDGSRKTDVTIAGVASFFGALGFLLVVGALLWRMHLHHHGLSGPQKELRGIKVPMGHSASTAAAHYAAQAGQTGEASPTASAGSEGADSAAVIVDVSASSSGAHPVTPRYEASPAHVA